MPKGMASFIRILFLHRDSYILREHFLMLGCAIKTGTLPQLGLLH